MEIRKTKERIPLPQKVLKKTLQKQAALKNLPVRKKLPTRKPREKKVTVPLLNRMIKKKGKSTKEGKKVSSSDSSEESDKKKKRNFWKKREKQEKSK